MAGIVTFTPSAVVMQSFILLVTHVHDGMMQVSFTKGGGTDDTFLRIIDGEIVIVPHGDMTREDILPQHSYIFIKMLPESQHLCLSLLSPTCLVESQIQIVDVCNLLNQVSLPLHSFVPFVPSRRRYSQSADRRISFPHFCLSKLVI